MLWAPSKDLLLCLTCSYPLLAIGCLHKCSDVFRSLCTSRSRSNTSSSSSSSSRRRRRGGGGGGGGGGSSTHCSSISSRINHKTERTSIVLVSCRSRSSSIEARVGVPRRGVAAWVSSRREERLAGPWVVNPLNLLPKPFRTCQP